MKRRTERGALLWRAAWTAACVALVGCSGATEGSGEVLDAGEDETTPIDSGTDVSTDVPGFEVDFDSGTDAKADGDGAADTGTPDTGAPDTGTPDTTAVDSATDSGPVDAPVDAPVDSTAVDSTPVDSTAVDSAPSDTGADSTAVDALADSGAADSATADSAADTAAEADTPPPSPPTVKVTLPALNSKLSYDKTSDACQSRLFTVTWTAPAGFRSMKWLWVTPNKATATVSMTGTCDGLPAYGYFMDATKYSGGKSGTFSEDVAIAGLYSGSAGSGRWWWCTEPTKTTGGGAATAGVSMKDLTFEAPPAPSLGGAVQTLSNYCYAKTTPADTDLGARWQLQVTIVDQVGATATDTLYFWVHQ